MEIEKALQLIENAIAINLFIVEKEAVVALLRSYKEDLEEIQSLKDALVEEKMTFVNNGRLREALKKIADDLDSLDHCASQHGVDGTVKERLDNVVILAQRSARL